MKNILMLSYWSYKDALIQTYTLPYVRIIRKIIPDNSKIFLVTFENRFHSISTSEKERIKQNLAAEKITWISFPYFQLGHLLVLKNIFSFIKILRICISQRITHIHAWCTPAGSLGYILSKLTGIPLIIDSYEPHAESMVENGTWKKNSFAFKLLFFFENILSKHAFATIATTQGVKDYAKEKYNIELNNFYVKPACVDFNLFAPYLIPSNKQYDKITCVYAGKLGGIYLKQEVFNFFKVAHTYWGDKFSVLMLTDTPRNEIDKYAKESDFDTKIIISKFVTHKEIPEYLALADFAINPVKPVSTKRYCTSIKDGEYWAMGLPVVIPANISDDSEIIEKNKIGAVLSSLNDEEYLIAIKKIDKLIHSENIKSIKDKIISIAKQYRDIEIAERIYRTIYT